MLERPHAKIELLIENAFPSQKVMEIFKISRPTFTDWCKKASFKKLKLQDAFQ